MRRTSLVLASILIFTVSAENSNAAPKLRFECKTPFNAKSCYWTRGRLRYGNGTPALRLWKVGTKRILGIYSGPSVDRKSLDNEWPELPKNVQNVFVPFKNQIFGDFEVCPLEPKRPDAMQASCVHSARNLIVEHLE